MAKVVVLFILIVMAIGHHKPARLGNGLALRPTGTRAHHARPTSRQWLLVIIGRSSAGRDRPRVQQGDDWEKCFTSEEVMNEQTESRKAVIAYPLVTA